ncbi:AraC family transcriptional regulator [Calothrix sp. NIES-4071]|nr:AraC family transcriptional regulator [Calothrix sp. NIES-4071]BAZ56753.1 AraC family transcriptional regulator [Calothrix sp. NIES-4105]
MIKIFIVDSESQESNVFLKYLGVRAFKNPNTEINVGTEEVLSVLPNDGIICEIEMPELNTCGLIRVLNQGSVIATIPFSFANVETNKPEQHQDINLTAFASDALLNQVFEFINNNYHQAITLCDVALAVGYSGAYLTDLVRRQTGKTVNHWILERRMIAARALLLETNQSANQIALAVGYQHEGHFFRQFRQHHGTTPQAWRKTQRSGVSMDIEAKNLRVS